jgi:hypothetical protein
MRSKALSDEEAHELLQIVKYGEVFAESWRTGKHPDECGPPPKRSVGERFRTSLEFFSWSETKPAPWAPPPAKYHLPIDDVLLKLMSRSGSPFIGRNRSGNRSSLERSGPFELSRHHLNFALTDRRNPAGDAATAATAGKLTQKIEAATELLGEIIEEPWYRIGGRLDQRERDQRFYDNPHVVLSEPTSVALRITDCQDDLVRALKSLQDLRKIVTENRSFARVNENRRGRPRTFWKDDFVDSMAHLWWVLTTKEASRTEDSLFKDFVHAAWNSYDEEMPEESFDWPIRNRTR